MNLSVHLLPSLMSAPVPAGNVAVLVDILRASTTITHAFAHGVKEVLPCQTVEAALTRAESLPERPLLGGERKAVLIPGFDLDNSPFSYTRERVSGKTAVFTTTNGTRVLNQCREAAEVLVGAFVNREAVADRLRSESRPIHIICAGTDGFLTAEDILFAGALATDLLPAPESADVQTQLALDFWQRHGKSDDFRRTMMQSRGGQNLCALGKEQDVEYAMTQNQFDVVPLWTPESDRFSAS
ncbi:MAG: 2-phosphosulfolactate phosphatase [Planctomycetaceae bacterium]|nr:2-phosphosulfolactate phosphatase [Planctomycetaceae bacterium]